MNITHSIESYEDRGRHIQDVEIMFKGGCTFTIYFNCTSKEFWLNILNQKNDLTSDRVVI